MSFDSTSELLFKIGADTGDAEGNVARFRSLMGKDLEDLASEFSDWSSKVFGDMSTLQGAMTGVGAGLAAAVVAVGAAANVAAMHYERYVEEVARGSATTGISTESMSALRFAAEETGTSYDTLVHGLTRFSTTVVKAAEGGEQQQAMFARLGISQDHVKAGQKDLLPLLMEVMDKFHGLGSAQERTAMAAALMRDRSGELVRFLSMGGDQLRKFAERAKEMGVVLGTDDVNAMRDYKAAVAAIEAEHKALDVTIGRTMLPLKTKWEELYASVLKAAFSLEAWKSVVANLGSPTAMFAGMAATIGANFAKIDAEVKKTSHSISILGTDDLDTAGRQAKEAAADFTGLSDVLEKIHGKLAGTSLDERETEEIQRITDEWQKVIKKFGELRAAGRITAADLKSQAAAMLQFPAAIAALSAKVTEEVAEKNRRAGEELEQAIREQGQRTAEIETANWAASIARRREQMVKEKSDTVENLQELASLEKAGYERIERERAETVAKGEQDLQQRLDAQREHTYESDVAAWDREMAALRVQTIQKYGLDLAMRVQIDQIDAAGRAKLKTERERSFQEEIARLDEHLKQMVSAETTSAQRLWIIYQEDLARYSDVEKKKALLTADGPEKQAEIERRFANMRTAIAEKYSVDLQKLVNSQGWQGVFGSRFAQEIRGNETLLRQWATSSQQSHMMVQVSLESLKEMSQQTFEGFAQAEGQAIASALVYSKSIGQAMEAAVASTLESLAARAMVEAIYSLGLGFLCLAEWDPAGAAAAFEAAAIFGTIGAGAALAGRAIAPKQAGAGGGPGGGAGGGAAGASTGSTVPGPESGGGSHVTVNVWGHVVGTSGVNELCGMINDAVLNGDSKLTATNTTTGKQVVS